MAARDRDSLPAWPQSRKRRDSTTPSAVSRRSTGSSRWIARSAVSADRATIRRIAPALALVCVAGAVLRFATLDLQSLWYDEAVTAQLLRMNLSGLLHAIPGSESSPPLYYLLAWMWTHVFGTGEVGLRSLSALAGTATIPVVWALGRRLGGDRAGLIAAALVAVNPMLVWFSQEARAYGLLVLLAALATLLWLRALDAIDAADREEQAGRASVRAAAGWSVVSALALATHYYAIFLVAPQALWLLARAKDGRVRAAAFAPVGLALVALAPLAIHQRANDSAAFIRDSGLLTRIAQVPKQLLVGYDSPAETLLAVLSAIVLLVALWGVWAMLSREARPDDRDAASHDARAAEHHAVVRMAALVAAALVLPAIAALGGEDHLITRNLLAVSPLGAALAGAGLAQVQRLRPQLAAIAIPAAYVLGLVTVVGVNLDPASQRDDWRGAVQALGSEPGPRIIVATPASAIPPLRYYLPDARLLTGPSAVTREVDYIALSERSPGARANPPRPKTPPIPAPLFGLVASREAETFTVLRVHAAVPQAIPRSVGIGLDGRGAALLVFQR
jgi:mannosyltransferase